jgi:NAD(P)-dependent dehydrogenase (short-subunit alcohol dehydrogenase family)
MTLRGVLPAPPRSAFMYNLVMHPLAESTILITGATDGLGRELAERLAEEGAGTLLLHGRNAEKLDETATEIDAVGDAKIKTYLADFASFDDVRKLASEVTNSNSRLDILINNAGIGAGNLKPDDARQLSADGHELRFAVNYLAPLLLTLRLLPELRASVPARVVNVASIGQARINFDDVMLEGDYSGPRAYGQSKLAEITSGFVLADLLPADEVTVNSLHPATYMPTKMVAEADIAPIDTLQTGIDSTLRVATDPGLDGVTGRFFNKLTEERVDPAAYEEEYRQKLWTLSLDLIDESAPSS